MGSRLTTFPRPFSNEGHILRPNSYSTFSVQHISLYIAIHSIFLFINTFTLIFGEYSLVINSLCCVIKCLPIFNKKISTSQLSYIYISFYNLSSRPYFFKSVMPNRKIIISVIFVCIAAFMIYTPFLYTEIYEKHGYIGTFKMIAKTSDLHVGIRKLDYDMVHRALLEGADPNDQSPKGGCPLYALASNRESSKFKVINKIAKRLLEHSDIEPNGDESSWSPLKSAVASGNVELVELLLDHHFTIPEVEVTGLDCSATTLKLPSKLKFYISSKATRVPKCFTDLPNDRKVTSEESLLAKRKDAKRASLSSKSLSQTKGTQPQKSEHDPRNAFVPLPRSMYPSRAEVVMNPTPFRNIYTAALFYFFGPPPSLWVGTILFTLISASVVIAVLTLRAVSQQSRNRRQLEKEVEQNRLEREAAVKATTAAVEKEPLAAAEGAEGARANVGADEENFFLAAAADEDRPRNF